MRWINIGKVMENRYNHLLGILIICIFFVPYVEHGERLPGFHLITLAFFILLVLCLRTAISNKRLFWLFAGIGVAASLLQVVSLWIPSSNVQFTFFATKNFVTTLFLVVTVTSLIRYIQRVHKITSNLIVAGICVYLLMGFIYAMIYIFVDHLSPGAISSSRETSFLYFSFATLTTVGYGDVVPANRFVMALASFEAITGQVYLTVFIARLIGLHLIYMSNKNNKSSSTQ